MPRILLDLRMVRGQLHGIARYALELARRLPLLAPDLAFEALVDPAGLPDDLGPLRPALPLHPAALPFLHPLEQPALALNLVTLSPALFHATSFSLPGLWPGPLVATLHDANHLALPEHYGRAQLAYYRVVVRPRAARARALVTVSEFSRQQLALFLRLAPERLQVIPNGVDERFTPRPASELSAFRERWRLPDRYLLAVGNTKPHKALGLLAGISSALPLPVVLLAGPGAAARLGFTPSTRDLGQLPEQDLPLLYAAASALAFPSSYEGFGLPALEAMASGCPVVAADGSALREVCRDAAVLFPPGDGAALRDALLRVLRDAPFREGLVARGLERAARFRWERCAEQTLAVYRRALGTAAGRR
jgi:glycosyltransferase involved in cell wall biosynthesis